MVLSGNEKVFDESCFEDFVGNKERIYYVDWRNRDVFFVEVGYFVEFVYVLLIVIVFDENYVVEN